MSVTDWAIVAAVVFWAGLVVMACWALRKVVGVVEEAARDLHTATNRVMPMLAQLDEVTAGVNAELARVDTIITDLQSITSRTDRLLGVVHAAVANPFVKAAGLFSGTATAARRLRE